MATANGDAKEFSPLINPFVEDSRPIFISPQSSYFGSDGSTVEADHDPGLLPGTVPPEHLYRTLVLCFDGTGDQYVPFQHLPIPQLTMFLQI